MKSLPKDLQLALVSTDNISIINDIGDKHGLLIDQVGTLIEITSMTLLGLISSNGFVRELTKQTGIDEKKAVDIAKEINDKLFNSIRTSLQKIQPQEESTEDEIQKPEIEPVEVKVSPNKPLTPTPSMITPTTPITVLSQRPSTDDLIPKSIETNAKPVERMGDFVVDITPKSTPLYKENSITKASVLKGIEDPEIDMADHMLSAPTVNTAKVEEKTVQAKTPPVINKSYGTDPYRESI